MSKENICEEFMQKIEKIRKHSVKEINRNELMSKKHKNGGRVLNYIDDLYWRCVSISAFAYLFGILIGITNSAIVFKICVVTAGIKTCKSIIKKKKKNHDKIVSLAKSKLNSIEVLNSKAIVDSNIIHDEFVLINNALKEFYIMKEEIKNSNDK